MPGSAAMIQPATWRDLTAVRRLEQVCFPKDAWPLWDIIGVMTLPNVLRLKAVVGREIVGFVACDVRPAQNSAWIATIGVLPEYRRRGTGTALLRACESRLDVSSTRLSVRKSNQSAVRLYERLDYAQVGVWPGYYQDGEDALVFEKQMR